MTFDSQPLDVAPTLDGYEPVEAGQGWKAKRTSEPPAPPNVYPGLAASILTEAAELVDGDRARAYGDAFECHAMIAEQWNLTLKHAGMTPAKPLDAHIVAMMLGGMKEVRIHRGDYRRDSYVDRAAYSALAGAIRAR